MPTIVFDWQYKDVILDNFICWFLKIPDVVWSAIIASLLTLFGVFLTNKGNEKSQRNLLEHEKQKFLLEQKMVLKKEVFLNLASSFANVMGLITKLMNLEFSQKEIESQLSDHGGVVAKTFLVAKEKTVLEILKFSSVVSENILDLMRHRAEILDRKKAIDIYQATLDKSNREKDRYLLELHEFSIKGEKNPPVFEYFVKMFEMHDGICNKNEELKNEQQLIMKSLMIEFFKKCIQVQANLHSKISPMTLSLRAELDNNVDSEIFVTALNDSINRMKDVFENLFDNIK